MVKNENDLLDPHSEALCPPPIEVVFFYPSLSLNIIIATVTVGTDVLIDLLPGEVVHVGTVVASPVCKMTPKYL